MQTQKNRKLNRLKNYNYAQNGWYFVTICVKNKEPFFGKIIDRREQSLLSPANKTIAQSLLSPATNKTTREQKFLFPAKIGETAKRCWQEIPAHFPNVKLDQFIIMPNHIHGIIIIKNYNNVGNNHHCSLLLPQLQPQLKNNYATQQVWQTKWARSLSSIVRGFKIGVTKWCRENNHEYFAWQKSFYDHIIRNKETLSKIRKYIINNPFKWEVDKNNPENLWI